MVVEVLWTAGEEGQVESFIKLLRLSRRALTPFRWEMEERGEQETGITL